MLKLWIQLSFGHMLLAFFFFFPTILDSLKENLTFVEFILLIAPDTSDRFL